MQERNNYMSQLFVNKLFELGINLTEQQLQQFDKFYELLVHIYTKIRHFHDIIHGRRIIIVLVHIFPSET